MKSMTESVIVSRVLGGRVDELHDLAAAGAVEHSFAIAPQAAASPTTENISVEPAGLVCPAGLIVPIEPSAKRIRTWAESSRSMKSGGAG